MQEIKTTDKEQIIIDEIECKNYNNGTCQEGYYSSSVANIISCDPRNIRCDFYIDRIEEQLARKTQECEKLRGDFHDTNEQLKDYKEHYDKQSEEYQKLKQDLFLAQNQITLKNEYIQKVKQECEELKAYAQRQENQREEYYKEYLKLSQECEELKKEIAFGNNGTLSDRIRAEVFKELNNENNQLKAENEKIKESRDYYKRIVDGCPDVCENGFCQIDFYNKKLTKTLTEIKEIAENVIKNVSDRCIETTPMYSVHKQILQKISEVVE